MNDLANIPGLYGKVPVRGDFVTRRLTSGFIETWDGWLQSALSASQEKLGTQWLETYLTSPIWHFVLSQGICGATPWTGILMPSVDKVGRYYPLTFAVPIDSTQRLSEVFMGATDWYSQMEQLALSALDDNLDLTELDSKLQTQPLPEPSAIALTPDDQGSFTSKEGRLSFHMPLDKLEQMPDALAQLGFNLLADMLPTYSLWRTIGSDSIKPCIRVYDRLPPGDAFFKLLVGQSRPVSVIDDAFDLPALPEQDRQQAAAMWPTDSIADHQGVQWRSFSATNVGKRRKTNEDAFLASPEIGLWAVADGMGGHSAGDVASKTVVDALGNLVATGNLESYIAYTIECLRTVNADLLEMADKLGPDKIMGTTIVVMLAVGKRCAAIWAGDSRLYQFREGELTQLTNDHSLANELSQNGFFDANTTDAKNAAHIVTRALGTGPEAAFDVITFDARESDLYLLCSDGLVNEVAHQEITQILHQKACQASTQDLIELALKRGARDNVTVVVAHTRETESP